MVNDVFDRLNGAHLGRLEYKYRHHVLVVERDARICDVGYAVEMAET